MVSVKGTGQAYEGAITEHPGNDFLMALRAARIILEKPAESQLNGHFQSAFTLNLSLSAYLIW